MLAPAQTDATHLQAEYLSDCMSEEDTQEGAWVIVLAMPKGGSGLLREWHSESIERDAPGLAGAMRDLWFAELQGARQQHVAEMAALVDSLRAERAALRQEIMELHGKFQTLAADKSSK